MRNKLIVAMVALALVLLFGGAGYKDVAAGSDLTKYKSKTIGGKQVYRDPGFNP